MSAGKTNPWVVAGVVSVATFMEVLDTTIINVALRNVAGGLSAGLDQAAWVVTSYLVANAVVLPISAWLSTVIGRKRFYMGCVALFALSSLACGLAWSLESLIVFRVLQGIGGGGLAPSEQSIIADAFPPEKRSQAFALYGVAVVVAPVVGPTLGGLITDNFSWHWVFLINVPIGVLSLVLTWFLVEEPESTEAERRKLLEGGVKFDYLGCLFVVLGLGCMEVVLDEGQRDDWFSSPVIVCFAVVSAVSLLALLIWEWHHEDPIVDVRLLLSRHFGACFLVMLGVGAVLITTTQFLPQLVQTRFGYDATLAGLALLPGGLATLLFMPLGGFLSSKVQPRFLVAFGMGCVAFAMVYLTHLSSTMTFSYAAWSRIFFGIGLPFLFIPITTASYDGLPAAKTNQASGLINVARNIGGSIGVSMATTLLAQRNQFHNSRLVEHISPSDPNYQSTLAQLLRFFQPNSSSPADATRQATAWIGKTVQTQVDLLSYIDVFWMLAVIAGCSAAAGFLLRDVKLGAPVGH
jgi:DHA2 family multidrug resistance protein